jgi:hypothetical protein
MGFYSTSSYYLGYCLSNELKELENFEIIKTDKVYVLHKKSHDIIHELIKEIIKEEAQEKIKRYIFYCRKVLDEFESREDIEFSAENISNKLTLDYSRNNNLLTKCREVSNTKLLKKIKEIEIENPFNEQLLLIIKISSFCSVNMYSGSSIISFPLDTLNIFPEKFITKF